MMMLNKEGDYMSDKKTELLDEEKLSKVSGGYDDENKEIYRYLILKGIAPSDPSVDSDTYIVNVVKENFPNSNLIINCLKERPNVYTFVSLDMETEKVYNKKLSKDELLEMLIGKFGPL